METLGTGPLKLSLWFENGDDSLSVRVFDVREAMNEPFTVDLEVLSPSDDLDLEAYVGRKARFEITTSPGRKLEGLVQSMTLARAEGTGLSTYRLRIVPRLWLLTQRTNLRIFQHLSIPAIVREVLAGAGVEGAWRVDEAAYPAFEYRVQYEETDYDYVSRLCEEAGIAFFWDADSKLTFADKPQAGAVRANAINYYPTADASAGVERFDAVELRDEVRPGRFTMRDHDFRRSPDFQLFGKDNAQHDLESSLELYHYRPGATWIVSDEGTDTPSADDRATMRADVDEGAARAKRKLEAVRAGKLEVLLRGNVFDLAPGVCFHVARHPHREISAGRALLVVASRISGDAVNDWHVETRAHFANFPYRPRHKTKKPRIVGVQSAIVVGPSGEEIHVDEFGRVRVQFHWDREGERNEKSSCWVRVSQGWAGGGQGMIVLPRIGQEVFIGYLEGDPDRPIVLGRCFNNTARVPHALPIHKTRSAWRSETSPRNGGYNEIMMEDINGDELFQMHAQKDMQKRVNNNSDTSIGNSFTEMVGNNKSKSVGSNELVDIGMNFLKNVGQVYKVNLPPPPALAGAQSAGAAAADGPPAPEKIVFEGEDNPSPSPSPAPSPAPSPSPSPSPSPGGTQPATPSTGAAPTHQQWEYNKAELTANGSTIHLQKDLTIETGGNMVIKAAGTVTIIGKIIHLNP